MARPGAARAEGVPARRAGRRAARRGTTPTGSPTPATTAARREEHQLPRGAREAPPRVAARARRPADRGRSCATRWAGGLQLELQQRARARDARPLEDGAAPPTSTGPQPWDPDAHVGLAVRLPRARPLRRPPRAVAARVRRRRRCSSWRSCWPTRARSRRPLRLAGRRRRTSRPDARASRSTQSNRDRADLDDGLRARLRDYFATSDPTLAGLLGRRCRGRRRRDEGGGR